ncbi:response regulator transcription factor [Liquorilactobacillus oeni]|uniref:Two-component system response regulator n=1 Tax=Liquorilactobacillus oeni DSM 19972 TaxID=1423777 RepID=A0A0R1MIV3_9LACO|nr:response regulator transcription factor [Liquorilactobacillus oeni]KRL05114.1 two-component system response regulator [Liquorilactobacillus oeni DSM 19972]
MISILICDDNEFVTSGMQIILNTQPDIEVRKVVNNAQAAIDYCQNNQVEIVLMDVRLNNGMNGVEATKIITESSSSKVIILTTFDEDEYISTAIINGAVGYLLKNTKPEQIIQAIKAVSENQSIIQQEIWQRIRKQLEVPKKKASLTELTPRERETVVAIAEGLTNREIARKLFLSEGTVNNMISLILHKLNLKHRTQVAIYYLRGEFENK